jgi:uncharacterized protein
MIERTLTEHLKTSFTKYPVVTLTGPRQSGKTTLVKSAFPDLPYVNLENPTIRLFAEEDPQGFLSTYKDGVILDEIQNVPELTSWIQVYVDEVRRNSLFVLTGSRQFEVLEAVSQSLAGRTAVLRLLPFSFRELLPNIELSSINEWLYTGFYPRIYDQQIEPYQVLADYFATYIERDIRKIVNIRNISLFEKFVKLCAGRVGQILNVSSLANDAGINHVTAREWLTLLEASYTVFLLPPFYRNIGKRLIKAPKLYFFDTGLASHLIGIEKAKHLNNHPLRGNLYENMIVMEILKHRYHNGKTGNLNYFRDAKGNEVDIVYSSGSHPFPIEIKAGETFQNNFLRQLEYFNDLFNSEEENMRGALLYNGNSSYNRRGYEILNFLGIEKLLNQLDMR